MSGLAGVGHDGLLTCQRCSARSIRLHVKLLLTALFVCGILNLELGARVVDLQRMLREVVEQCLHVCHSVDVHAGDIWNEVVCDGADDKRCITFGRFTCLDKAFQGSNTRLICNADGSKIRICGSDCRRSRHLFAVSCAEPARRANGYDSGSSTSDRNGRLRSMALGAADH
jgi:hypothetical protein